MHTETPVKSPDQQDVEMTRTGRMYRPLVDILENREGLTILADMPGTSPEDVDIKFEDGSLTIHGRAKSRQPEQTNYLLREYGIGDFHRVFQVSESIDVAKIRAEYVDGVLKLHLPKVESARPRKIEVQSR